MDLIFLSFFLFFFLRSICLLFHSFCFSIPCFISFILFIGFPFVYFHFFLYYCSFFFFLFFFLFNAFFPFPSSFFLSFFLSFFVNFYYSFSFLCSLIQIRATNIFFPFSNLTYFTILSFPFIVFIIFPSAIFLSFFLPSFGFSILYILLFCLYTFNVFQTTNLSLSLSLFLSLSLSRSHLNFFFSSFVFCLTFTFDSILHYHFFRYFPSFIFRVTPFFTLSKLLISGRTANLSLSLSLFSLSLLSEFFLFFCFTFTFDIILHYLFFRYFPSFIFRFRPSFHAI